MPPEQPLANRNNNPGDLRFIGQTNGSQGQGGFASFPTPEDGTAALLNDIQSKINKNPNETLDGFANVYAPESDGNDSMKYAADLANQMGVSPDTTIGSLEPKIGDFAAALAKNEGYQTNSNSGAGNIVNQNSASQAGQTAGQAYKAVGGAPGVAIGAGVGAAGLLGGAEALGGEALSGLEGIGGDIAGAVGGLLGGNKSQQTASSGDTPTQQTQPNLLGTTPTAQEPTQTAGVVQPSSTYNTLSSALGSMVGGQDVLKEGQNRGIDPIQVLEQSGASSMLQPDENGNINKVGALDFLNGNIAQDKGMQTQMVQGMSSPISLNDAQARAEQEVESHMTDTGEKQRALKEVQRTFDDYRAEQPFSKDEQGNVRMDEKGNAIRSDYIMPARYQKKKDLIDVGNAFTKPAHERAAAAHIKTSMGKHLSEVAKREGKQGWDETNRRMEAMILAKKAVKKLPKKALRDKGKEFRKGLIASVAGGLIGKTLGHGTAGAIVGGLIERQLGSKEYKKLGTKKERGVLAERAKQPSAVSLAGIKPKDKRDNSNSK